MANESLEDTPAGADDPDAGLEDRKPSASVWPMFVAFGLAIAEVGVVVGVFVLTVVGVLMFTGSVAGIVSESGYVENGWRLLAGFAVVVFALGAAVFVAYGGSVGGSELIGVPNAIAYRGLSMIAAGIITLLTAVVGQARHGLPMAA